MAGMDKKRELRDWQRACKLSPNPTLELALFVDARLDGS